MSDSTAERQLLLGILAMQNDFVTQDQFLTAFRAWSGDKTQSFSQILVRQQVFAADVAALLESLVAAHVRNH